MLAASNPEAPNPQSPVVQRLRIRYAKRGRLRFSSHRDFQRALERALRRANVPVAFSQGFSPHPRISYANSAATGAASEAEYVEIAVTRACDPDAVRRALDDALPPGLDVVEVVGAGAGGLAERLEAGEWEIRLPGVEEGAAHAAVQAFLDSETVEVQRLMRSGVRSFDARAAVVRLSVSGESGERACAILRLVVRHSSPSVRPDDVLAGLRQVARLEVPVPPQVTRLAQGPLDESSGTVGDPLAPDREAARTGAAGAVEFSTPADA